jgi:hypothetical protein
MPKQDEGKAGWPEKLPKGALKRREEAPKAPEI